MITLCGFAVSNYYNKVKLVLLEKGIAFKEELVMTGSKDEAVLQDSPLAKVPFIRTPQGALCESQVIVEYLEQLQPQPALLPADPFAAAKVRELCTFIDLHLELVARNLAEKLMTYAMGRGLEFYDEPAIKKVLAATAKGEYRFSSMILAIVQSDPFRMRRGLAADQAAGGKGS